MNFSITTKKIAANTIYQLLGKGVSLSITVLATAIITRAYGKFGYGEFSLMQAWPALFFIIADFGLNAIAVKDLAEDWSKASKYFANLLALRLFLSGILITVSAIALVFFPYSQGLQLGIFLSLLLILTQALYATLNVFFQVKHRYDLSTIGYVGGYLIILASILLLSYSKADVMWVSFSYVAGGMLTFFLNLFFIKRLGVSISLKWDPKTVKYLLLSSLPLGLMFIFSQINFKGDSILLSVLPLPKKFGLSAEESVGIYNLPFKIFEVALVLPTFFMNSVYPVLVTHMNEGRQRLKDTFSRSIKFLFFFGLMAGIFGILFAQLAVNILGGAEFMRSIVVLQILMSGVVLYFVTQPISWLIVTLGKQSYLPGIYLIGALLNLFLNIIFIPAYSFYASAIITHISELIVLIMLIIALKKAWKAKYA
ncbi:hypothetical protein A3K34_02590 [candidate division WWE3 bacterium RIFOXYC1_FULL_40_10]|uniref:Uncharacterized protein n=1 Tax=candidate division WWE3 bacterium RIFOXYA2_FULL_46_9 TaxID=1802636 RepID=A0A1F4W2S3_UNCKA|nr:MAG: hypothetical protein A3K58_02590 [candidate division WWE3 bacterium RIFOXYB1_FULL_40_22]OGC61735.1 MAG: hypothetical protein A3K37_02590 [candidate division WWE3 bacterium RIFOXYA1_FULL_40_11]OGC63719.1 MAG: hypothetical protein A2264_05080 [candidate division WWE3 bacterium RIFOXYA2_FULL_46_9]OGC65126.1 MAG: hypothetical protein A2326_01015 [candidate division WWE3 bacterium RIFOXYB2_FULL_41_6]OGC66118.1 MAG: hypothetical protein A3K34_02590 [candidate division WWE3 bacterium RIFOXYC1_